ncbi:UBP1-associated protein 2A-like [Lycium ferocissimum]|uniref:UBP1-associated protein 2A-like n=1 Tax=Lycium ferocissimum TaxID=112874 RepID=UPI002815FF35|nr:UBP1-associated protein 2A-like [Lycium ferocissimum]
MQQYNAAERIFEILTFAREGKGGNIHKVSVEGKKCSCGKWRNYHMPCSHAIKFCYIRGIQPKTYVSKYYSCRFYKQTHSENFSPLGDEAYWPPSPFSTRTIPKHVVHDAEEEEETLEKLLEPFSEDQLTKLIKQVIAKNPNFKVHIQKLADKDSTHRKIFVYGLGWDTTAETLTGVFEKHGEIEACNAVTDKVSGKSKGYGFILFKHRSSARKALREPQKKICTRMTSCQLASAGPVPVPVPQVLGVSEYTQRKIFVSNVAADLDPQKLLEFFSKFGEVEEGPLGLDKQTGKPKGFCLFVYKSVESAKKALEEPHKSFEGHILHCQKAIDGPKHSKQQQHYPQQQQQQHYQRPAKKAKYSGSSGGAASAEHLMAPSGSAIVGFNPAVAGVTPALGQALIALLAMQGAASLGMGKWYLL